MLLPFDRYRRRRMALAVFLNADAEEDHEHNERDDALLFRSENEEVHERGAG